MFSGNKKKENEGNIKVNSKLNLVLSLRGYTVHITHIIILGNKQKKGGGFRALVGTLRETKGNLFIPCL